MRKTHDVTDTMAGETVKNNTRVVLNVRSLSFTLNDGPALRRLARRGVTLTLYPRFSVSASERVRLLARFACPLRPLRRFRLKSLGCFVGTDRDKTDISIRKFE